MRRSASKFDSASAQLQAEVAQADPGIAFGLSLDLLIDELRRHQQALPACDIVALQGLADQRTALVPDGWPRLTERTFQRHALTVLLGDIGQQTQLPGQGPENNRGFDSFAAQPF